MTFEIKPRSRSVWRAVLFCLLFVPVVALLPVVHLHRQLVFRLGRLMP